MSATVYLIDHDRYLTSGAVAERLGIAQKTVIRWAKRIESGKCPALLKGLVVKKDPLTGFVYFKEKSVEKLADRMLLKQPLSV